MSVAPLLYLEVCDGPLCTRMCITELPGKDFFFLSSGRRKSEHVASFLYLEVRVGLFFFIN